METNSDILNNSLPIKAYPKTTLLEGMLYLKIHIAECCKLTRDKEYLNEVIDAINELCREHSFKRLRVMFERYRDSLLDITPMTNHMDRILFGQILKADKKFDQNDNRITGGLEMAEKLEKEREQEDYLNVINWFDWFIQNRKVTEEMTWVYDYLILKDKLFKPKEKFRINLVQTGIDEGLEIPEAKAKAKRTLLRMYFERLEEKKLHLKHLL